MSERARRPLRPPGYGVDRPFLAWGLVVAGGVGGAALAVLLGSFWPLLPAALAMGAGAALVAASTYGRPKAIEQVVAALDLRGDERVLDLGCRRGVLTVPVARALAGGGQVVALDQWPDSSRRGTGPDAIEANLGKELGEDWGEHVEVVDGPLDPLPFPDASFDVVTSWLGADATPLAEVTRVLRPGGRLVLAVASSPAAPPAPIGGLSDVTTRSLGWSTGRPVHLLTGRRLGAGPADA